MLTQELFPIPLLVLHPSPLLWAFLAQEPEVLLPDPVLPIPFVQLKLSLGTHDMWVPGAEG